MFAVEPKPLAESPEFVNGEIGIAPPGTVQKGDLVCLILGCSAPLVIRPTGRRFVVVSAAYIDNLMDGRAMPYLEDGLFELETFDLE